MTVTSTLCRQHESYIQNQIKSLNEGVSVFNIIRLIFGTPFRVCMFQFFLQFFNSSILIFYSLSAPLKGCSGSSLFQRVMWYFMNLSLTVIQIIHYIRKHQPTKHSLNNNNNIFGVMSVMARFSISFAFISRNFVIVSCFPVKLMRITVPLKSIRATNSMKIYFHFHLKTLKCVNGWWMVMQLSDLFRFMSFFQPQNFFFTSASFLKVGHCRNSLFVWCSIPRRNYFFF